MTDSTTVSHQINSVIDHLADKLHVPAQHVWNALLLQVKLEFWQSLIFDMVIVTFIIICVKLIVKWSPKVDEEAFSALLITILSSIGLIVSSIIFLISFSGTIEKSGALWNPEYYALQNIAGLLKGQ